MLTYAGDVGEAVSAMVSVANELLGVLTVWVAHYDGSVSIWVASDMSSESIEKTQHLRHEWKARQESLAQIHSLTQGRGFSKDERDSHPTSSLSESRCVLA